ncbi:MAG: EVE domain-containing protein [Solirubrobacterales bacterium]
MAPRTWILTGSSENLAATRAHGSKLIGLKEGRRGMARQIAVGDRIVFYVTGLKAFAGAVRVTGELFEDRARVWPGKPGKADPYPWRFATAPEIVLDAPDWVPAAELAPALDHTAKWPPEHWTLAFQGQIRAVSEHDAALLMERMGAMVAPS